MKKNLFFLFALVAMMCVFTQSWAAQVTFRFVYDGTAITSWSSYPTVAIYKGGEQLTYGSVSYGSGSVTLTVYDSYVGQTVVYTSSLGHQGSLTVTESEKTIDMECKKLTVTTKDKDGNALTYQYVYIYDENGKSYSVNTDYQGNGSIYLPASDAYTYKWENGNLTGKIDLSNDSELNLVKGESVSPETKTEYMVKVVCRYGDYPVNFSSNTSYSFYINKYGDTNSPVRTAYISSYGSTINNSFSTELPAGAYWIRDHNYVYSQKIEVAGDMTAYLDYQKVKFVSKTGNTPNAGQVITYRGYNGNSSSYYSSNSVTTNANGEASVYLLRGNYVYIVNGNTYNFTVGDEDQTINIQTSRIVITLNCDDQSALDAQTFELGTSTLGTGSSYSTSTSTTVTPVDGKITVAAMPGNYVLTINGISTFDITVNEGENNVNVQLYSVMFTTNLSTVNSLYLGKLNNSKKQIGFNTKYYLTPGEYSYSSYSNYYSSSSDKTFTLDKNKEIALNYGIVTVTVKDTDDKAVSGISVYESITNSGVSTDVNGQAVLTIPYGTCEIFVRGYESKTINVSGDISEEIIIPSIVTFNVLEDGQPYKGRYLYLYNKNSGKSLEVSCSNGIAMARITPGETWSIEGYKGTVEITEGCTVSLGTLRVSSEGMGVAFPMTEWSGITGIDTYTFGVIVGSTVRLTAIPVKDDGFQCWVVNGNEIASPVIDLEVVDVHTTATAVFEGAVPSARGIHCDVNRDGTVNGTDIQEVINTIVNAD